nr:unnamed protein product [Callosobruchus analis]
MSTGVTRGRVDQVGESTHVAGDPPMSGEAHDQACHLSGRTQLAMNGDVHVEHCDAHGQARASGGTALSGEALGRGSYAAVPNACRSVDSYARDTASTVLDSDALRNALANSETRMPPNTVDTCGETSRHRLFESSIGAQTDVCGDTSSRLRHRACIGTGCEFCLESSPLRRCPVFWPESEACGESWHVSREASICAGVCGGSLRSHRIDTMTANGEPKTKEQACSTLAKAKDSLDIHERRIQAMANISQAGRRMRMHYDRGRSAAVSYKIGDLVLWCNAATLKAGEGHSRKLVNKFEDPTGFPNISATTDMLSRR